ncbi:MAG: lipoate--protein ligase family protein [Proteobacteria bacterium]|nr:lipoate--protein ligase family protein [Pseudomonadota bacterium]
MRGTWAAGEIDLIDAPVAEGAVELQWLDAALETGRRRTVLWQGVQGLVAPMSYRRYARLDSVREAFAADGWPVHLRRSGGGVVPQGPGILNLTRVQAVDGAPGDLASRLYELLCGVLVRALRDLGIEAAPRAVEGSFCDGRFNLAVGGRKIAGIAQYWRRGGGKQAVLAHALLLVDADCVELTARANAFEAALGSERRYCADALTTMARECRGLRTVDIVAALRERIVARLAGAD